MDRRLLTAVVALLVVALPVSADDEPSDAPPDAEPCLPLQQGCAFPGPPVEPPVDLPDQASFLTGYDWAQCSAFDYNAPSQNTPLADTLVVDPDGCLRRFVHQTVGLPPPPMNTPLEPNLPLVEARVAALTKIMLFG
jgi:hypothetical protein